MRLKIEKTMSALVVLVWIYMFSVSSYSFHVDRFLGSGRQLTTNLLGYKDMLAAAQASRGKPAQRQQRALDQNFPRGSDEVNRNKSPSEQRHQQGQERTTRASNPNELPFDDEMYDNLKLVIGKITQRMKSAKVLTSDEIRKFDDAVKAIVTDSQGMASPNPPNPSFTSSPQIQQQASPTPPSPSSPSPQANFLTFQPEVVRGPDRGDRLKPSSPGTSWVDEQGKWSKQLKDTAAANDKDFNDRDLDVGRAASWQIPGMESMSSDEYYAAINKRVAAAKVFSPSCIQPNKFK